jgi:hypothetical protein
LMFWILLLGDVSTAYDICYIHNKNKYACVWCSTYTCIYVDSIHARNMHMNKRRWVSTQPWCDVICNPCNNINMQTMCFANYGFRLKAPLIYKQIYVMVMFDWNSLMVGNFVLGFGFGKSGLRFRANKFANVCEKCRKGFIVTYFCFLNSKKRLTHVLGSV